MFSHEHLEFIKNIKKSKVKVFICQLLILVIFISIWQLLSNFNIINTFIYSSPYNIVKTIINLVTANNLFYHIFITLLETIISFSLGSILGLIIASILWSNKFISKVLDPYLTIINSLPKVALGPIIIIWFGAGMKSIIVLSLLISTIISIINIYEAFIATDSNKIKLLTILKATKWQIYTNLILPSNFKAIINSIKINVSMSLIGVIMGEFLVSQAGIGYLIMYGSQVFNLDLVMTGVIILGILSLLLYYLVNFIEKKLIKI